MSLDKADENKMRQLAIQEATLVARGVQLDESVRRLREIEEHGLSRHTQTMTWILTAISAVMGLVAVSVAFLAYSSKSETDQAVRDMRQQSDHEAEKMERHFEQMKADFQQQFNAFAGDALKRPKIEISISSGPLTNQILHITRGPMPTQIQLPLFPLFIKNVGGKASGPLSISLYSSEPFSNNGASQWEPDASNDPEFPVKYHYNFGRTAMVGLAPGEPMSIQADYSDFSFFSWNSPTNLVLCKIVVFCGNENPSEARFRLKNGP